MWEIRVIEYLIYRMEGLPLKSGLTVWMLMHQQKLPQLYIDWNKAIYQM